MKGNQAYWDKGKRTCFLVEKCDTAIVAYETKKSGCMNYGFFEICDNKSIATLHCPGNIVSGGKHRNKTCSTEKIDVTTRSAGSAKERTMKGDSGHYYSVEAEIFGKKDPKAYRIQCKDSEERIKVTKPLGDKAGRVQFECV